MNKKTIYIIIGLVVLVSGVVIIASLVKTSNKTLGTNTPVVQTPSTNETVADNKSTPTAADNPALAEVVDIEKIDTEKTLTAEELDLVEFELIDAPKTVADVELMSEEEKISMNIDPKLVVQVLGRLPDGRPTSYKFITSEEDLLIDTRE